MFTTSVICCVLITGVVQSAILTPKNGLTLIADPASIVPVGTNVTLTCSSEEHVDQLIWYLNGVEVLNSSEIGSDKYEFTVDSESRGIYHCSGVSNSSRKSVSKCVEIKIGKIDRVACPKDHQLQTDCGKVCPCNNVTKCVKVCVCRSSVNLPCFCEPGYSKNTMTGDCEPDSISADLGKIPLVRAERATAAADAPCPNLHQTRQSICETRCRCSSRRDGLICPTICEPWNEDSGESRPCTCGLSYFLDLDTNSCMPIAACIPRFPSPRGPPCLELHTERYDDCQSECRCSDLFAGSICPRICKTPASIPRCTCKNGYFFDLEEQVCQPIAICTPVLRATAIPGIQYIENITLTDGPSIDQATVDPYLTPSWNSGYGLPYPTTNSAYNQNPSAGPEPLQYPTSALYPVPAPYPQPAGYPRYNPYPTPAPYPEYSPDPAPAPYPIPVPYPAPAPYPGYNPYPMPAPYPEYSPYPAPAPYPVPIPYPAPVPYPGYNPYPGPATYMPAPYPVPVPYPMPATIPYPPQYYPTIVPCAEHRTSGSSCQRRCSCEEVRLGGCLMTCSYPPFDVAYEMTCMCKPDYFEDVNTGMCRHEAECTELQGGYADAKRPCLPPAALQTIGPSPGCHYEYMYDPSGCIVVSRHVCTNLTLLICSPDETTVICSACDRTCDDVFGPQYCDSDCASSDYVCACKYGLVRETTSGKCIPQRDCVVQERHPPSTGYNSCPFENMTIDHNWCQPTCSCAEALRGYCRRVCMPPHEPKPCMCKEGYFMDSASLQTCRSLSECSSYSGIYPVVPTLHICPPVQLPTSPPYCHNYYDYDSYGCISGLQIFCRDTDPEIICEVNEVPVSCFVCERSCTRTEGPPVCSTVHGCSYPDGACQCAKGFVRDVNRGKCVTASHCPTAQPPSFQCDTATEEYKDCGPSDVETCEGQPVVCEQECVAGCFCKHGYVRDREGIKCIPKHSCSTDTLVGDFIKSKCLDPGEVCVYIDCPTYAPVCDEVNGVARCNKLTPNRYQL